MMMMMMDAPRMFVDKLSTVFGLGTTMDIQCGQVGDDMTSWQSTVMYTGAHGEQQIWRQKLLGCRPSIDERSDLRQNVGPTVVI